MPTSSDSALHLGPAHTRAPRRPGVRVVLLSGGGGGARFARGLASVLAPGELTVIGNVGDDLEILGLHVSPDLDSLLYTLGGLIDAERGWGRAAESWSALESAGSGAAPTGSGSATATSVSTSSAQRHCGTGRVVRGDGGLCRRAGLTSHIVPATDDPLRTHVITPAGRFPFQEWFVGRRHEDEVDAVEYEGADRRPRRPAFSRRSTTPTRSLFAPSNPYLSVGPILAVAEIRAAVRDRKCPLRGGEPAGRRGGSLRPARSYAQPHGRRHRPGDVAARYDGLVDLLVIDESDAPAAAGSSSSPRR